MFFDWLIEEIFLLFLWGSVGIFVFLFIFFIDLFDGKRIFVYCVLLFVCFFFKYEFWVDGGFLLIVIFIYCKLVFSLIEGFLVLSFFLGMVGFIRVFFGYGFLFLLRCWCGFFLLKFLSWGEFLLNLESICVK